LEKPGVDRRIIFSWILRKEYRNVDLIHPSQNRDQWRTLVNMVMNIKLPQKAVKI
jgi:hypothetical protein